MIYKFFVKKSRDTNTHEKSGTHNYYNKNIMSEDQQLANELRRPITKNFKKHKIYSSFRDKNCGSDYWSCRHAVIKQV